MRKEKTNLGFFKFSDRDNVWLRHFFNFEVVRIFLLQSKNCKHFKKLTQSEFDFTWEFEKIMKRVKPFGEEDDQSGKRRKSQLPYVEIFKDETLLQLMDRSKREESANRILECNRHRIIFGDMIKEVS